MVAGCHTHTSPSVCCSVSLSHQCVEECGSQWDFCLRTGLESVVSSTLFQVRCVHNECSERACAVTTCPLCDWGALWVPASVTCSVSALNTWGFEEDTCLWDTAGQPNIVRAVITFPLRCDMASWWTSHTRAIDGVCETLNLTWKLSLLFFYLDLRKLFRSARRVSSVTWAGDYCMYNMLQTTVR